MKQKFILFSPWLLKSPGVPLQVPQEVGSGRVEGSRFLQWRFLSRGSGFCTFVGSLRQCPIEVRRPPMALAGWCSWCGC